ncbi:hypothetical protein AAFF_G00099750 [Aldrovandia affinis]|uniref:Uncharacterized protein n=1 Tax=Aldrovandia affinis TaxID=143900 RepID=A0AAD7RVB0_9TELE|nr:hypothetical protein AAFF_G00099750 [Aldrovandia affinis]
MDSGTPRAQSPAEPGGNPEGQLPQLPDALLSAREEPGAEEEAEAGAETANKPPTKQQPGLPDDGSRATATASSEATAIAPRRGPSPSSTPPSEESRPTPTTALDGVQRSASSLSDARESDAASSPSTPFPHPYLTTSPSSGRNTAAGAPAQPRTPEEPAGPSRTEPPQGGHPGAGQGVTASPGLEVPCSRTQGLCEAEHPAPQALQQRPLYLSILSGPPEVVATVTADGARSSSGAPRPALPSGPLPPWQTSGTETSDAVTPSVPPLLTAPPPEPPLEYGTLYCEELGMADTPTGTAAEAPPVSKTTAQTPLRTVAMATGMSLPRHKSGLEELESEEERDDEEEEDEGTQESKEAESRKK